jgi:hypothetical protein
METKVHLIEEARMLAERLERISADSVWAHRSSGLRGTLIRLIDQLETGGDSTNIALEALKRNMELGFNMLVEAGKEKVR